MFLRIRAINVTTDIAGDSIRTGSVSGGIVGQNISSAMAKNQSDEEGARPGVENNFYGPVGNIAQNSSRFSQAADLGIQRGELAKLLEELTAHFHEMNLDARQEQRAKVQMATIEAELDGVPDSGIVRQAMKTLRAITEGAIGSLVASGAQAYVWPWIANVLAKFS